MSGKEGVVAVTCLALEAGIARGPGVSVICNQSSGLRAALRAAIARGASGIISFGIAGGLAPGLAAGDWVVASGVRSGNDVITTDRAWAQRLLEILPNAAARTRRWCRRGGPGPRGKVPALRRNRLGCRRYGITHRRGGRRRASHSVRRLPGYHRCRTQGASPRGNPGIAPGRFTRCRWSRPLGLAKPRSASWPHSYSNRFADRPAGLAVRSQAAGHRAGLSLLQQRRL